MTRRYKLYACKNLREEVKSLGLQEVEIEYLDFGYHRLPEKLPAVLQERLKQDQDYDVILLGYGLCSKAIRGVKAVHQPLVIPRVHDCIALFLGSQERYQHLLARKADVYFLTRGWLDEGEDPCTEYEKWCRQYGEETARWLKEEMYRYYREVYLVDTGVLSSPHYYQHAAQVAEFLGARFQVYQGDLRLLQKLLSGPWDKEFLILEPGEEVNVEEFY